jgi:hypothetical protein
MDARHVDVTGEGGLIRLTLPRGVLVILTPQEFARALKRGKSGRRAASHAARVQQTHARDEAQTLGWIGDEGPS